MARCRKVRKMVVFLPTLIRDADNVLFLNCATLVSPLLKLLQVMPKRKHTYM